MPLFGTLIALARSGRPILGIIDQPISRERWIGAAGPADDASTARRSAAGACPALAAATLFATSPDMFNGADADGVRPRRRAPPSWCASAPIAMPTGCSRSGFIDLVIEASLKPYDFCAMVPIVEGAGGIATDWQRRAARPRLGRPRRRRRRPPRARGGAGAYWRREPRSRRTAKPSMRRAIAGPASLAALGLPARLRAGRGAARRRRHGMSLFGDLKYGPDFKHFDYVNPDAPKGGTMQLSAIGTFDTLNPFVVKGVPAAGIGQIFDTLMASLRGRARQRIRPRRRKRSSSPRTSSRCSTRCARKRASTTARR